MIVYNKKEGYEWRRRQLVWCLPLSVPSLASSSFHVDRGVEQEEADYDDDEEKSLFVVGLPLSLYCICVPVIIVIIYLLFYFFVVIFAACDSFAAGISCLWTTCVRGMNVRLAFQGMDWNHFSCLLSFHSSFISLSFCFVILLHQKVLGERLALSCKSDKKCIMSFLVKKVKKYSLIRTIFPSIFVWESNVASFSCKSSCFPFSHFVKHLLWRNNFSIYLIFFTLFLFFFSLTVFSQEVKEVVQTSPASSSPLHLTTKTRHKMYDQEIEDREERRRESSCLVL